MTFPNGIVATYGYDNANRLTSVTYTLSGNTLGNLTYTYDLAGNRTSVGGNWARTGLPASLTSATYDAANRIATWAGTSFTYDLNGNLTGDGTTTYSWNARNQLTGLSGGASASFAYDATGRRRGKTISGATTNFLYDGLALVQELSSGGTPSANLLTGLGIDETLTRTDASGTSTLLVDALGSTLALADGSGTVQTQYTFDPFGATTASGATSTNAQQFTGRDNDGTSLYFYRSRYYHPERQRFASEDPADFRGGLNLYSYVGNAPVLKIDPLGEGPGDKWWGYDNRDFQDWFHRQWKRGPGPDASREEMDDAYREWRRQGSPPRDPKGDRRRQEKKDPQDDPPPDPTPQQERRSFCEENPVLCIAVPIIVIPIIISLPQLWPLIPVIVP